MAELGMTAQRVKAVTFSWPYIIDLITYAHPAPHRVESYAAMMWPFDGLTWMTVISCLLISSVIIQFFTVSHGKRSQDKLGSNNAAHAHCESLVLIVQL